jgi:peroxiredoxin
MNIQESIKEAEILREYISQIRTSIYHLPEFKESEVRFRAETLQGFVSILQNDVYEMIKTWYEESKTRESL